nr:50S ribosomal protein L30 [uncultured Kingella sp.]
MNRQNSVRVTLIKSLIGVIREHKACVFGLGLHRRGHTVCIPNTQENMGMIKKVCYLLRVES